jgi:5-hydroxyisourate hydrolase-like protein (transthyretin family)
MWYTKKGGVNTAIKAQGPFNAIVKNLKVNFMPDNENAFLKLATGDTTGNGYIQTPVFQEELVQNKDYKLHLKDSVMWRSVK